MDKKIVAKFLTNTDDTGRFIVTSQRTGRSYFVEPIDGRSKTDWTEWGSIDPASGKMMNKPGFRKYAGAIDEKDSLISEQNGFKNIKMLEPGMSPMAYINHIDDLYPAKE